jgi:hypothetical protein
MQLAIADNTGKVALWCYHDGTDEDGTIHFSVINGAWAGTFKDNTVYVEYTKGTFPGFLVWAGTAGLKEHTDGMWSKFPEGRYHEAMHWIQDQIDDPEYQMISFEQIKNYKPIVEVEDFWDDIPF